MWVYACVSSVVFVATAAAVAVGGVVSVSVIGIGIGIGIGITVVVVPVGSLSVFVMYFGHCAVPNYDPSHPFRVKKNGVLSPNRNSPPHFRSVRSGTLNTALAISVHGTPDPHY